MIVGNSSTLYSFDLSKRFQGNVNHFRCFFSNSCSLEYSEIFFLEVVSLFPSSVASPTLQKRIYLASLPEWSWISRRRRNKLTQMTTSERLMEFFFGLTVHQSDGHPNQFQIISSVILHFICLNEVSCCILFFNRTIDRTLVLSPLSQLFLF